MAGTKMSLSFDISGSQIDGSREYQEDEFLISHLVDEEKNPAALIAVADGMGGHAAGNVAANLAVQAFNKHISANYPGEDVHELLHSSVMRANATIAETIAETAALQGMGCTIVAAVVEKGKVWWASVGDSHLYLFRGGKLYKKNADHSYGGFMDRLRASGREVSFNQPGLSRNVLMSALTGEDIVEIDCPEEGLDLLSGDRLIFSTDGMDTLSEGKITQYSKWGTSAKECVDQLLQGVTNENRPRQDNTTVLVVDVYSGDRARQEKDDRTSVARTSLTQSADATLQLSPEERKKYFESMYRQAASASPGASAPTARRPPPRFSRPSHSVLIKGVSLLLLCLGAIYFLQEPFFRTIDILSDQELSITISLPKRPSDSTSVQEAPESGAPGAGGTESATVAEEMSPPPPPAPPIEIRIFQDSLRSGGKGPEMVTIAGGSFRMGTFSGVRREETPIHPVQIQNFALGRTEIKVGDYRKYLEATGRSTDALPLNPQLPMSNLSWKDAVEYTRWLSEQTGHKYRLPSEAEWEYTASGKSRAFYWWGPSMIVGRAHCRVGCGSSQQGKGPLPVASFPANAHGLYDTAGNVSEWVEDCWHKNYQGAPSNGSSWREESCTQGQVTRGGSYDSPSGILGSRRREQRKSFLARYMDAGLRVARDL